MKRRGRPPKITGKKIIDKPVTAKKRGRPPKITEKKVIEKEITDKEIISKEKAVLTPEQIEERREKIRATIPKIDLYKTREEINIIQNKKECAKHTEFACHRPDVYLDYGCSQCSLAKGCACPLKDLNRIPDGKAPKIRKFVTKPKIGA